MISDLQANMEKRLGTVKEEGESWADVFQRLDVQGRLDLRVVIDLMAMLLDSLPVIAEEPYDPLKNIQVEVAELKQDKPKKKPTKKKKTK